MRHYPLNLKINGRRCVVVGGGSVGERKVKGLIECGASVTVVSPTLTTWLESLVETGAIEHVARDFRARDIEGAFLVFATTYDPGLNSIIAEQARQAGTLVNNASSPHESSFATPSVIRRGEVMITASTGGASPALSKHLRLELEEAIGEEYAIAAKILGSLRVSRRSKNTAEKAGNFKEIPVKKIIGLLREGDYDAAGELVQKTTGLSLKKLGISFDKSPV